MESKCPHVCYIAPDVAVPFYRGASVHVLEVAKGLASAGSEVHVIARRLTKEEPREEKVDGFKVHRVNRGIIGPLPFSDFSDTTGGGIERPESFLPVLYEKYLFSVFPLYVGALAASLIKKHGLQIILERETSFGAGAIAGAMTGRPVILEMIGPRYSILSARSAKRILAYSSRMVRSEYMRAKTVYVNAGVDTDLFRPDEAARSRIREKHRLGKSPVIGYVGSFQEWHGISSILKSSKDVLAKNPDARYLMVGPYYRRAQATARELGVSESFVFTGPIPHSQVPDYVNASDIMLAPYDESLSPMRLQYGIGSPLKVLEYMACSKPIIGSRSQIMEGIIQEGEDGFLISPGDTKDLTRNILMAVSEPDLRKEIGLRARAKVLAKFTWQRFTRQLADLMVEAVRHN